MRVLLVNPRVPIHEHNFNMPALSGLAALYSAAYLRRFHDVGLVDSFLLEGAVPPPGIADRGTHRFTLGAGFDAVLAEIDRRGGGWDAVVVGKARWWSHEPLPEVAGFLRGLRARFPEAALLFADMYLGDLYLPPYDPRAYLAAYPEADGVLHGAGELALHRLLSAPRPAWAGVPGLAFRDPGGERRFNGFHYDGGVEDLDEIPPPAFDLEGTRRYVEFFARAERSDLLQETHDGLPLLAMLASRGCNHRCSFCALPNYAMPWRAHSPAYLERAVDHLVATGGARKIVFNDPSVNLRPEPFLGLLRMLVGKGLTFLFPNGLRADQVDDEAVELHAAAGATLITSLESPDPETTRHRIHKGLDPDRVTTLARRCHQLGVRLKVHYVIGLPGETVRDVNRTLAHALRLLDAYGAHPLVQIATPIPGTDLAREVAERGWLRLPADEVARDVPALLQGRAVISTPQLPAATVERMNALYRRHVVKGHPREHTEAFGYRCNNRCAHCLVEGLALEPPPVEAMLERIAGAVGRGVTTLVIEGGEATAHPELPRLIREARRLGMADVMLETNGRMLSYERWARALARSGLTMLFVSVHGPNAGTHDRATRAPGSFEQTFQGVRNVLGAGFRDVSLNVLMTRALLRDGGVRRTVERYAREGVRRFMLQYPSPRGGYRGKVAALPSYAEAAAAAREAVGALSPRAEIRVMNLPFCALPGLEEHVHADVNNLGALPVDGGRMEPIVELLALGKEKDERCEGCEYGFLCTGRIPAAGAVASPPGAA